MKDKALYKEEIKSSLEVKILSFLITIYAASQIVFALNPYNKISNFLNLIIMGYYIILYLLDRDGKFFINDIVLAYALFSVFAISSVFWTVDPITSGEKAKTLFLLVINNLIIYNIFKRFDLGNAFLNGTILGSFINYLIAFDIIHLSMPTYLGYRFFGTMGNPNALSITMVLNIAASMIYLQQDIDKKYKIFNVINIILAFYMIILTVSRTGLILGFFLITVYVFTMLKDLKRIGYLFLMISLISIYMLFFADTAKIYKYFEDISIRLLNVVNTLSGADVEKSTLERKEYIEKGLEMFSNHPFGGIGIDTFRYYYGGYSHNNFVELLLGVGLIGEILYYSIFALLFVKISKIANRDLKLYLYSIVTALLLVDMGSVSYYDKQILLMIIFIGYIAEKYGSEQKVKKYIKSCR